VYVRKVSNNAVYTEDKDTVLSPIIAHKYRANVRCRW